MTGPIRELRPHDVQFMVNPRPLGGKFHWCSDGVPRPVYSSCNHLDRRGNVSPHPYAFRFVVLGGGW